MSGISVADMAEGLQRFADAAREASVTLSMTLNKSALKRFRRTLRSVNFQANMAGYMIVNKRGRNKLVDLRSLSR
jgi:hypothetical protein